MNFLRQKIYRYSSNFFSSLFISRNNINNKTKIFLKKNFKFNNILHINMARIGLYLILKMLVYKNKKIILMSPFTIFDIINKILSAGAVPKFVDTYKYQPHISLTEIKKNYDKNVIAILVTHYHSCHPEIDKIRNFCNKKKIYLIEDCAISLGGRFKKNYIGHHGDFSIFSFGLYKFISTPLGGLIKTKSKKNFLRLSKNFNKEKINFFLLSFFFMKGLSIKFILNNNIFKWLVKKIIKIGIIFNLKVIDNIINNDPNPKKIIKNPIYLNTLPSKFQLLQVYNQLSYLEKDREIRGKNAFLYGIKIKNKKIIKPTINYKYDPIIHYPIICNKKNQLYKKLIRKNFDISNYYYRNCSEIKDFKMFKSKKKLQNINFYSKNVLCLPVYPGIDNEYIKKLSDEINRF